MQSQNHSIIYTSKPTITVPSYVESHMPSQHYSGGATEAILAMAVLIRSVTALIQALDSLRARKANR